MLLVADDDEAIRETLAMVLTEEGYEVLAAADGLEAVRLMARHKPCMVLLDLMMPNMDGWEVFDAMKADAALADVPVCIVSATVDEAPTTATCVLRKPVRLENLLEVVRRHC